MRRREAVPAPRTQDPPFGSRETHRRSQTARPEQRRWTRRRAARPSRVRVRGGSRALRRSRAQRRRTPPAAGFRAAAPRSARSAPRRPSRSGSSSESGARVSWARSGSRGAASCAGCPSPSQGLPTVAAPSRSSCSTSLPPSCSGPSGHARSRPGSHGVL